MYKLNDKVKLDIERKVFFQLNPCFASFEGTPEERNGLIAAIMNKRKMRRVEKKIIEMAEREFGWTKLRTIEELNSGNLNEWLNNIDWEEVLGFLTQLLTLLIKIM